MEYEELLELEKTKKLTAKQERFCQEYVLCLIGSAAYKKVYPGVNDDTARTNASRLLSNANIKARVRELQEELKTKYDVSAGQLLYHSFWVISKAQEGKPQVMIDKEGNVVKTGNTDYDMRAINDAIKNISNITGINAQNINNNLSGEVKTESKLDNLTKQLFGDDA